MAEVQGGSFAAISPFTAELHKGHLGAFIDDLFKIIQVPDGTALQALLVDMIDNNALSQALDLGGYVQNVGKQDTLVSLGSRAATKEAERRVLGRAQQDLIHVGGYVSVTNSNLRELDERVHSAKTGRARLGDYWFSGGPWKSKRLSFLSNVAGRLWSGLESYALRPRETHRLDKSLARKLRAMMRGGAHQIDEHDAHRSLTTLQLFREWQVAPTAIELLVRRLSWRQTIVAEHANHSQYLARFFGR